MLFLSVLIILALGVAVAGFFITGGQWLLVLSGALVLSAFYVSRRTAKTNAELDAEIAANDGRPARERLVVTIDNGIIDFESHRHRDPN
jgi:hypothetical protein